MNPEDILNNVENLSATDLADYIDKGIVTYEQVQDTGYLDLAKGNEIEKIMKTKRSAKQQREAEEKAAAEQRQRQLDQEDDDAWEKARYGDEVAIREYLAKYPNGRHVKEARDKIDELESIRRDRERERNKMIRNLCSDRNYYHADKVSSFIKNGVIYEEDLMDCGFPQSVIDIVANNDLKRPSLKLDITPESIPNGFTEVYMWGIPGSGKTCALGAIMRAAEARGLLTVAAARGSDYAIRLKNIFSKEYVYLPSPTPKANTQYLPFTLQNPDSDKHPRSVSLIELSGEVFKCFYDVYYNGKKPGEFESQELNDAYNSLMNFVSSDNRKIHFFFIDYKPDDNAIEDGLCQSDYLNAASSFFRYNNIFKDKTDAIYIVLTKSDEMDCPTDKLQEKVKEYLECNTNIIGFVNQMKTICRDKKSPINGGNLCYTPFSIGQVFMKDICKYDPFYSNKIVDIMIEHIQPNKKSILGFLNR